MAQRFPTDASDSYSILGDHLHFQSGKTTQNRFLKAAMTELLSSFEPSNLKTHGLPTQRLINVYDKWGNGKFGLIITGNVQVCPNHLEGPGNAIIFKEGESTARRESYQKLSKAMKQDGALGLLQLSHGGRQTPISINKTPFSASDVKLDQQGRYGQPVALTTEQIKTEVIDRFVYAAKYAYETGFSGVQIHGAHGYLLAQFTSPTTNKRTDKYGGSVANRQRIILEIYEAIRKEIPASTGFVVGLKTNSVEFQAEGTTLEDAIEMCKVYEEYGFDFVELSGGTYEKPLFLQVRDSTKKREAFFLEFAEKIRPVFKNTIVYLTGGFRTVNAMVDAVTSGGTQGIGLARPVTAEPDLPKKILKGEVPSAINDILDKNNYLITLMASNTQIEQMGRNSLKEANNDVSYGISDFSDEATVTRFLKAIEEFMQLTTTRAKQGIVTPAVLTFEGVKA
uniref:Oxidored_FMN domain-containing protein n=1 Tax=Caenorhabditis japonica TaxID=281687 RepID=A0A8R1DUE6_CAEJA